VISAVILQNVVGFLCKKNWTLLENGASVIEFSPKEIYKLNLVKHVN
jgi:hypothetical protein